MVTIFPDDFPSDFLELGDIVGAATTGRELSITRARLGDLLERLPVGLLIHQEQGIVFANEEAARIFSVPAQELRGRHFLDFVDGADFDLQRAMFMDCLRGERDVRAMDCVLIGDHGRQTNVQVSMAHLPWEGLPVVYVLVNDLTALKETVKRLRRLSITDPLTGIHNRRHFLSAAEKEVERARRYARPLALLALDIDHFKGINDAHGHAVGDEALKAFTIGCATMLRTNDVFGRMGGEEFAVLLPETDEMAAMAVGERIRERVRAIAIPAIKRATSQAGNRAGDGPALDDPVRLTVSIGVAATTDGATTVDHLLSAADTALYLAKDLGRDRVVSAQAPAAPPVAPPAAPAL